jgi:hypothetical protein
MVSAYDTTASSLEFIIVDSLNNPISGCKLLVSDVTLDRTENSCKLKSNTNGWCKTRLFHITRSFEIMVFKNDKLVYRFLFKEKSIGYNYLTRIKICK